MHKMDPYHIALICDDNYVIPTIVTITSLIKNKTCSNLYCINIITTSLNSESINKFKSLEKKDVKITIIKSDIEKYKDLHKYSKNTYCVATPAALLKFDLPNLLNNCAQVLYLDGDIIVKQDLYNILQIQLGDYYVAAVKDSGNIYTKNKEKLNYSQYFNSGVMLLNLKKMRKDKITDKLVETKRTSRDMSLMDQNVFNKVFDGKIKLLDLKYNVLYVNLCRAKEDGKLTLSQINEFYHTSYKNFREIYKNAAIIHYASKDKPWKYYNTTLVNLWDQYYKLSPLGHEKLKRDKLILNKRGNVFITGIKVLKRDGLKQTFIKIYLYLGKDKNKIWKKITWYFMNICRILFIKLRFQLYKIPKKNGINREEKREHPIIISMTTIPYRINSISIVVGCMMRQTTKPDKIQLYLGEDKFKDIKLPLILKWQKKCGLEIIYCKDLKPHTKYYYAMKNNPDAIIITIDDDIFYHKDIVEKLYNSYKVYPNYISALRTHLITFDKRTNKINSYNNWRQRWSKLVGVPHMRLFATGVGGVLYPPHVMHTDLLNEKIFMELCPVADDLWLKAMQILHNTPCVLASEQRALRYIDNTQDIALNKKNVGESRNDIQLSKILDYYNKKKEYRNIITERMKNDTTQIRNRDILYKNFV